MTNAEEIALQLRSAIPIDDVDQMLAPGLGFAIVWIAIPERPSLQIDAKQCSKLEYSARSVFRHICCF